MRKNPPVPQKKSEQPIVNSRSQSIQRLSGNAGKKLELPSINKKRMNTLENDHREPRKEDLAEQALNNLIHQYFIKYNYMETLTTFQEEFYSAKPREEQHLKEQLITAFDRGQRDLFFQKFNKYVPIHIRLKDQRTTKLEFYLNIYFMVFSSYAQLQQSNNKKKYVIENNAKQAFQHYLESRGAALAKTSEFLPFYALVYIQQPHENANFKHIFTRQWADQLRDKLTSFIEYLYPVEKTPLLVQIYERYIENSLKEEAPSVKSEEADEPKQDELVPARISDEASMVQINRMEQQIKELTEYNDTTTKKYYHLWNNFKEFEERVKNTLMESQTKWFQITQEFFNISSNLLNVADNLKKGIPLQNEDILENIKKKVAKYESFVNTNIEDLISENIDFSLFDRPSVSAQNDHPHEPSMRHARSVYEGRAPLIQIDFDKVKATLSSEDPVQICLVLQALRWRIIHLRGIYPKRQAVLVCTKNDILGSNGPDKSKLLRRLLHWEPRVIWQTVQFVNALAGDYQGRTYLSNEWFIECIIEVMLKQKSDTDVRKLLLTTLQKISLRRTALLCMINNGLVKWTVNTIKTEKETMSAFSLEYIVALLINLSLSKEGLQKFEQIRDDTLKNLIDLLENESSEVRTFVSATLFTLLYLKSFRMKAKEYGLSDMITYLKQSSSPEYMVQLGYLQNLLQLGDEEQDQQDQEIESNCDIDEINDESMGDELAGNQQDETADTNGKLSGESLLIKEYALTGPAFIDHKSKIHEEVENSLKRRDNSMMKNDNSVDRPISQNRSIMRPFMKSRSAIGNNNSSYSHTSSNRILPSEMRQRNNKPQEPNPNDDIIKPISPISPGPRPLKEYERAPQYRQAFETRSRIIRTPPRAN